jgi:hypothetical protein
VIPQRKGKGVSDGFKKIVLARHPDALFDLKIHQVDVSVYLPSEKKAFTRSVPRTPGNQRELLPKVRESVPARNFGVGCPFLAKSVAEPAESSFAEVGRHSTRTLLKTITLNLISLLALSLC